MRKIDRTGETELNKFGSRMTITEYKDFDNIVVRFENGYEVKSRYIYFKRKNIISPYDKTLYDKGYLGEGKYRVSINGVRTIQYQYWRAMIERCYSSKMKNKFPTYKNVSCCGDWQCFQNFSKWFDENYYEIDNETMDLDKDIIHKGNKIYSPQNCCFVPHKINCLFIKSDSSRGKYPIGVSCDNRDGVFSARIKIINKDKYLGRFTNVLDAFNAYKKEKEKVIKQIADEYKDKIPDKLYNAMYKYKVEITD